MRIPKFYFIFLNYRDLSNQILDAILSGNILCQNI